MYTTSATATAVLPQQECTPNPTPFPQNTPVAMAYIPFQQFGPLYAPDKAFDRGTVFPDLDMPFLGGGAFK